MDLTTLLQTLRENWLVSSAVAVVLVFGLLRLLTAPPRLEVTRHELQGDIHDDRAPSQRLVPSTVCRDCHTRVTVVEVHYAVRGWAYPSLRCPACGTPLPVIDWVDDTHVEILS